MRHSSTAMLLAALVTACGVAVQERRPQPVKPIITHLEGQKRSATVGDAMTSSSPLFLREVISSDTQLQADTKHRGKPFHVVAEAASYALVAIDPEGSFYESLAAPVTVNGRTTVGGLFIPRSSSARAAIYWHWVRSLSDWEGGMAYIAPLVASPKVRSSTITLPPKGSGLVSTLTYAGVAGGQIKFVYREYVDGMARPAFTQDVSLDYIPETTYAYKSARFIVHHADSVQVEYTLLGACRSNGARGCGGEPGWAKERAVA